MRLTLTIFLFVFCQSSFSTTYRLDFKKLKAYVILDFTKGPNVLMESVAHVRLYDEKTSQQIPFGTDDNSLEISLSELSSTVLAPIPKVHSNYIDDLGRMASRFFFTAGGSWRLSMTVRTEKSLQETQSLVLHLMNTNNFPKDTKSFPYTGKVAHSFVGMLGGTGCRRRWDFVDTHDSLHMNMPFDLCGKYAMVSGQYHKWVDLSTNGDKVEKLQLSPLKGDAVLEKLNCPDKKEVYKLVHYPECGKEGKPIAYCDGPGNSVNHLTLQCK